METIIKNNLVFLEEQFFLYETGNDILDFILIEKNNEIVSNNINLKVYYDKNPIPINDEQLFILFGNLIDNAIENCDSFTYKTIIITMGIKNDCFIIKIENTIKNSILQNNPSLFTTKEDKENHGFGITSIKKIVELNNGYVYLKDDNYYFKVNIILPLKK